MQSSNLSYLKTASSAALWAYLSSEDTEASEGPLVLGELLLTQPAKANEVLCQAYGIACYQVSENAGCHDASTPPSDYGKWFVSVVVGSEVDVGSDIALADTLGEAQALAAKHLRLADRFFGEYGGGTLPVVCPETCH